MADFKEIVIKKAKMCEVYTCSFCPLNGKCTTPQVAANAEEVEKIIQNWKPPVDWSKIAVDTPIVVYNETREKFHRHFAKFENGIIYTFDAGRTSWSEVGKLSRWKNGELAEVRTNDNL